MWPYIDTYRSEDDVQWHRNVVVEHIIIRDADDEEQYHHHRIRPTHNSHSSLPVVTPTLVWWKLIVSISDVRDLAKLSWLKACLEAMSLARLEPLRASALSRLDLVYTASALARPYTFFIGLTSVLTFQKSWCWQNVTRSNTNSTL